MNKNIIMDYNNYWLIARHKVSENVYQHYVLGMGIIIMTLNSSVVVLNMMLISSGANKEMIL